MKNFMGFFRRVRLLALIFLVSCNPEEYYPLIESIEGVDRFCGLAKDVTSCMELGEKCQAAYLDLEVDTEGPVFTACVANPTTGTDSNDEVIEKPEAIDISPPVIETIGDQCENIPQNFLFIRNITQKDKTNVVTKVKICHNSTNSPHTIIVSCSGLIGHAHHRGETDYLGPCKIN